CLDGRPGWSDPGTARKRQPEAVDGLFGHRLAADLDRGTCGERWHARSPVRAAGAGWATRPAACPGLPGRAHARARALEPAKASDSDLAAGMAAFRAQLGSESPRLEIADEDIQLLKSYRSEQGEVLLAFLLKGKQPPPDEVPGPEWGPHWFIVDRSGA